MISEQLKLRASTSTILSIAILPHLSPLSPTGTGTGRTILILVKAKQLTLSPLTTLSKLAYQDDLTFDFRR